MNPGDLGVVLAKAGVTLASAPTGAGLKSVGGTGWDCRPTFEDARRRFTFAGIPSADLLPLIPPDAVLGERSSVKLEDRGKVPGHYKGNATWVGLSGDWATKGLSPERQEAASTWPTENVGLRAEWFPAVDIDVENPALARELEDLARQMLGSSPVRTRESSSRVLLAFRLIGDEPITKLKVKFKLDGQEHALEVLGRGQQYAVAGVHPSKTRYDWRSGFDLRSWGADGLTQISAEQARAFFNAVLKLLEGKGATIVARQVAASGRSGDREKVSDIEPVLDAATALDALNAAPNTDETLPTRENLVALLASYKAARGREAEDDREDVCDWATAEGWATTEYFDQIWDSLTHVEVGPKHLLSWAQKAGWPGWGKIAKAVFDKAGPPPPIDLKAYAEAGGKAGALDDPPPAIAATPFTWIKPSEIPPRRWIYGNHYIRKFVSVTVAPGGVGKTALSIVEALAMASGKALLGVQPRERFRVCLWNGEDPHEELQRRVMAAAKHYGLTPEDLEGWLFVNSGRDMSIVIATQTTGGGVKIAVPKVEEIKQTIRENQIDVVIIDPFVSSHQVTENDNNAIDRVAKTWAQIADETDCTVELVHHSRKTYGNEATVEDGRGASALLAAARSARVLNVMSEREAEDFGLENRRLHFRVENGKSNLTPPPEAATWFKMVSVNLGNGNPFAKGGNDDDTTGGDSVGVVTSWECPDLLADITEDDLRAAQAVVAEGRWRASSQATDWVGKAIARALSLDLDDSSHKAKVKRLIKEWIAAGWFFVVKENDGNRQTRPFVKVGKTATG
jgi:hypothetical protein